MRLAFYQPDIPQNLGAMIRIAACFGLPMDIIQPCAFPMTARALRRSAMDYGAIAEINSVDSWDEFESDATKTGARIILMTTKASVPLNTFEFQENDRLLFGQESSGAPPAVHDRADARVIIPIRKEARSFNVAVSAGIVAFEALRQTSGFIYK